MGFLNINDFKYMNNITSEEAINLIIASVALEELGISHALNVEGEKIQTAIKFKLNTLKPNIQDFLAIDESIIETLRSIIKKEILLLYKLNDALSYTTTTSVTTTSETTTTSTVTSCHPSFTYAIFANRDFINRAILEVNENVQVNGNLSLNRSGSVFLGNTNVVGTFFDSGGNTFENLNLDASSISIKQFDIECLKKSSTVTFDNHVNISNMSDALPFQNNRVWVNGHVNITGSNITIMGSGIIATEGITVTGKNFTYITTDCIALFSLTSEVRISNGPYNIKGLIYTASPIDGDIDITANQGGTICGDVMSSRDVKFTGNIINTINNQESCSSCVACLDSC